MTGTPPTFRHRLATGMAVLSLVATATLGLPAGSRAADPAAAGAQQLAETRGGTAVDYQLVYERSVTDSGSGEQLWSGKYLDQRNGEVAIVAADGGGQIAAADLPALERKADTALRTAIVEAQARNAASPQAATPLAPLLVAVWLDVDVAAAEESVIARHPELTWVGGAPLIDDLEAARRIRAELWEARRARYAAAQEPFRAGVEAAGGSIGYASTAAPLVFADLPAGSVAGLAERPDVVSMGLERPWKNTMSSAGPAVQADWSGGADDQGNGVRVAVVEYHNVRNSGDLGGQVVASGSTSGSLAYTGAEFDHPTWVAGAVAGLSGTYRGIAPGADIVSSSTGGYNASLTTDRAIIAAADWAIAPGGGDADVVNASIGQDTATGAEEARRYFDSIVAEDGRLVVAAAGNYTTFGSWDIVSPGTGYNVLTVGGVDDRGSAPYGDDIAWYVPGSNGSNYRDRTDASWNTHGDYNKPNVSAPAVNVRTANGLTASGTSVASPIVSGVAAQLIARYPTLSLWPEATRALIMAGAIHHSELAGSGVNADHEGVGTASALWTNRILNTGDGEWGGHRFGAIVASDRPTQEIAVMAGQKVKVVLTWNSHTSGGDLTKADRLMADLELRIVQPDGSAVGSFSFDNNYESVEFTATRGGTATVQILNDRFEAASERYALAWAKWSVGTPTRLAGSDRYATAATISAAHFAPGVPVAYVATGENFPDALAAGPLAGLRGGPVLLTRPDQLPAATANELSRLRPQQIVVLGSDSAVSPAVVQALQTYSVQPVQRLAGVDRYATAAAVSESQFGAGVAAAFVATGGNYPDALAGGPAAIKLGGPMLLTRPDALPSSTANELSRLRPQRIYLLGGEAAISAAVASAIQGYSSQPIIRLSGADRFATALAVSQAFFSAPAAVFLATGLAFPDALAAVPAAGRAGSPLLIVRPDVIPAPIEGELLRLHPPRVLVMGGPAAVWDGVVGRVNQLLGDP